MADNKLKIGITQGDTNGIGWEVILKTFADNRLAELFTPVIYGSPSVAAFYRNRISGLDEFQFNIIGSVRDARRGRVNLFVCGQKEIRVTPGEASAEGGRAAVDALQCAMRDLKEEALDALVTAPIDKQTAQCDDFRHTGHTEYLAAELGGEPGATNAASLLSGPFLPTASSPAAVTPATTPYLPCITIRDLHPSRPSRPTA